LKLFRISPACAKPLRRRQGFHASDLPFVGVKYYAYQYKKRR
jgi:hypothetical protein